MKALFKNVLYVIVEVHDTTLELEEMDGEDRFHVPLSDRTLIVDPTDGDLDEAEGLRNAEEPDDGTCQRCDGEGLIHDCGEDTCCCPDADQTDLIPCSDCNGTGVLP